MHGGSSSNNLRNNLIAVNIAPTDADGGGTFTSAGHNLIGQTDGSTGFASSNHDLTGTAMVPLDPKLDPNGLVNNGGPTKTIALLGESPAIDAATSAGTPTTEHSADR